MGGIEGDQRKKRWTVGREENEEKGKEGKVLGWREREGEYII
jgi:hypothetical protein